MGELGTRTYSPSEIAKLFQLHSNTIRLYEKMGFISKANRKANGYREYTEKHILQLKIVRAIFAYPFTNHHIRERGGILVKEIAEGSLAVGKQYAYDYIERIDKEIEKAEEVMQLLENWATQKQEESHISTYTRKEIASLLGVTTEAVRNWERNDLIKTEQRGENHQVLFLDKDLGRLKIIYMLRQCGYSMSAIHRCLARYDEGKTERLAEVLDELGQEELLSAGDSWISQLKSVKAAADQIPDIIDEMSHIEK